MQRQCPIPIRNLHVGNITPDLKYEHELEYEHNKQQ